MASIIMVKTKGVVNVSISSIYSSTTRISGMYSGLDTESLIEASLATEQSKLDKLYQQQQLEEWRYEEYTEINSMVSSLRDDYFSVLGDKSVVKSATYNIFNVNMAVNAAVSVSANANAMATSFQILSVSQAKAASATKLLDSNQTEIKGTSGQFLCASASGTLGTTDDSGNAITESTTISALKERFVLAEDEALAFSINGETFTFSQDTTLREMLSEINGNEDAKAAMDIDYTSGVVSLKSTVVGADTSLSLSSITGEAFGNDDAGFALSNDSVIRTSILHAESLSNMTFMQLAEEAGLDFAAGSITINGTQIEISETDTVQDVIDRVNTRVDGVTMSFDENSARFVLKNNSDGDIETAERSAIEVSGVLFGTNSIFGVDAGSYTSGGGVQRSDSLNEVARKLGVSIDNTLTVSVNGVDFSFDAATTTLSDMMSEINSSTGANATFSYSEMTDSFQISSDETGSNSKLSISGFEDLFGISQEDVSAGADASMRVNSNGIERTITESANTFTLDGMTFNIIGTADFSEQGGLSVSVEQDYQSTVDAVKSFVEDYNALIEKLNTLYYETKYSDYQPLTDEQRAEMTEKEQELWDEKARSGILRNDSTIGNLITNLRSTLSVKVGDTGFSAFDLGITTTAWSTDSWRTEQGKLVLDEDALLAALKEDPNAVQEYFTQIATAEDGNADVTVTKSGFTQKSESGLFQRMNAILSNFNSTMRSQNIQSTKNKITSYEEKISDQIDKMYEKEESLWAKYSALETVLSELQSQSDYFTSMLGSS